MTCTMGTTGSGSRRPGDVDREADEQSDPRGFWRKARRTVGKVPFLDEALAAYYCALDPRTPGYVKAVLLGALAYFVVPTDMIPDFIAGLGYGDDATVLLTAIGTMRKHVSDEHREDARRKLTALAAGE